MFFFFFFQAEDGIRDVAVTGVQTCALPISPAYVAALLDDARAVGARVEFGVTVRRIVEPAGGRPAARVLTSDGSREASVVLNCAGLHADRLAGGLAGDMRLIPFPGHYAEPCPGRT